MMIRLVISLLIFETILLIAVCSFLAFSVDSMQHQIDERDLLIKDQWSMMDKQYKALDSLMGSINNYFKKQEVK